MRLGPVTREGGEFPRAVHGAVMGGTDFRLAASLSLVHLTKRYGSLSAVEDFSLEVKPGEFVTLLGPSGSGKTTTLMMLAGFVDPTSGDILIGGERINDRPPFVRNLGIVFQNYALFPHLSVGENVAFPLRMRRLPRSVVAQKVEEALCLVHLEGFESRRPRQLSGGQQQRVALARAIVFDPAVLLMDEPLGALDRLLRDQMQTEIKRLHRELAKTVVYVTHDQEEALALSDRIVVMNRGRIEQIGAPHEIYEEPRSEFVATFLGESNILEGEVVGPADEHGYPVSVGGRVVRVGQSNDFSVGAKVRIILRPERLVVLRPGIPGSSKETHRGIVEEVVYQGKLRKLVLSVEGLGTLVATELVTADDVRTGERLDVSWKPADARVVEVT